MDRRDFLKTSVALGCVTAAAPAVTSEAETPHSSEPEPGYKFFTADQAVMVGAICEQIVPRDEYPGANESGAVGFIDGVLSGPMGRFYTRAYREGLLRVKLISHDRHGKGFAELAADDQTKILRDFESGAAAGISGKRFFGLIVMHTLEGYYGNPGDGGNRDGASWKMINFQGRM